MKDTPIRLSVDIRCCVPLKDISDVFQGRDEMQQRKLGYTDLHLTTIGFGAWAIGGPWDFGWGPQNDDESIATIQAGLDAGINWIDTAPAYGLGHSEEVVAGRSRGAAMA
jgi:diketogulonate reductase-like aldo/keto reductase